MRPYVLSIAGFDPCGGAGVLADIKTFEALNCFGLGACSALTFQNEHQCLGLEWLSLEQIAQQLEPLLERYEIKAVKLGILPDLRILRALLIQLRQRLPVAKIIWDPIIRASSGFDFLQAAELPELQEVLEMLDCLTPNRGELLELVGVRNVEQALDLLPQSLNIYLKSYTAQATTVSDLLIHNRQRTTLDADSHPYKKHGSGCVLASALAAGLAQGLNFEAAAAQAQKYTQQFLQSSPSLLGVHKAYV